MRMIMFLPKSAETIVFEISDDARGIPSLSAFIHSLHSFPKSESSRAAPTLGPTRARGHDDGRSTSLFG